MTPYEELKMRLREAAPDDVIEMPDGFFTGEEINRAIEEVAQERKASKRTTKADLLDAAKAAVADRGLNYGKPEDNFERIAGRWRTHLKNRFNIDVPIDAASVALMMVDMKQARLENDPSHLDSWTDIAGYAACGAEISA